MRQRFVVRKHESALPGVPSANLVRHVVEVPLHVPVRARSQKHKLPAALERAPARVLDEVYSLLVRQARDDTHQRSRLAQFHAQPFAQFGSRRALPLGERLGVVVERHVLVRERVPELDVDTVAYAHHLARVGGDGVVVGDFLRVRRRHRRGKRALAHRAADEVVAELQVVDGENRRRARGKPVAFGETNVTGAPVVRVDDVRNVADVRQVRERALGEVLETHVVVAAAVDAPHVEVPGVGLQKRDGNFLDFAFPHVAGFVILHRERVHAVQVIDLVRVHAVVLRENNLHGVPILDHRARQRRDDVAHASDFGDGRHLDGDLHDAKSGHRAAARADNLLVVIQPVAAVVPPLHGPRVVREDEIAHVRVRWDLQTSHQRGLRALAPRRMRRGLHAHRPETRSVRPAVPAALHEDIRGAS
mmetsp:Transcript_6594/g.26772  ORF Transcript_6594/g.26772 Transcript_6594/m.26772 type:complete len:418 (-) Transcript_6594:3646-4899(-)